MRFCSAPTITTRLPIEVWDQNDIESVGLSQGAVGHGARNLRPGRLGQASAQLILQRGAHIRNAYAFKLSFEYCLLEPMDLVALTDPGLGLENAVVRITAIEEDNAGTLAITAEEFPAGVATAVAYPVQTGASSPPNRNTEPAAVNPPLIVEPPASLTEGAAEVWIAVSGGTGGLADPNWGGAVVYVSRDNVTYGEIGEISGPARQGSLAAQLPAPVGANPDSVNALAVNLSQCGGVLAGATPDDAANGVTLCIVDNELLSYANASLTGANAYALTYLERGLFGSQASAHAPTAPFARLDDAIFKYALPQAYIGATLYLKFQSVNIFGDQAQDLSSCIAYPYTPRGSGALGPVAQTLGVGASLDYGLASYGVNEADDFGLASDPYATLIDLGLASA